MKGSRAAIFLVLITTSVGLFSESLSPLLAAYQKSFDRGSLSTKIQVLQDSSENTDGTMEPLYIQALKFVLSTTKTLYKDPAAEELTLLAVRLSGLNHYDNTAGLLWELFKQTDNDGIKVEILSSLGAMAPPAQVISELNKWLWEQNIKIKSGKAVNGKIVSEAVKTLGKIGDPSSFAVVFSAGVAGYNKEVVEAASSALKKLKVDYGASLKGVVENNSVEEKLAALRAAAADTTLSEDEKGEIFQAALKYSLSKDFSPGEEDKKIKNLRVEAVKGLTALKWAAAQDLALKNMERTLEEVNKGISTTSQLVDSINFLGSIATHEAAVRLTAYLEVLNSRKERGQEVSTQVVLAVIHNLDAIGDKIAFDNLLYAGYLNYPSSVKAAAREAMNNLKSN